jgi:hypothetical protein
LLLPKLRQTRADIQISCGKFMALASSLAGRLGFNGQSMHASLEFRISQSIDHAVALQAAFAGKGSRDDFDPKMRLTAGFNPAGMHHMARMLVRFINDIQCQGLKRFLEFG